MAGEILYRHGDVCHRIEHQPDSTGEKGRETNSYGAVLLGDDLAGVHRGAAFDRNLLHQSVVAHKF